MLRTRISDALKTAMKSKQTHAVSTIRLIMAALKDRDIAARPQGNGEGIADDEILSMLQSMIKQRRESVEMYEKVVAPNWPSRKRVKSRLSRPSCPNRWMTQTLAPPSKRSSRRPGRPR